MYVCVCVCLWVYMFVCVFMMCVSICVCMYVCVYICVGVYLYMCVYVCVCLWCVCVYDENIWNSDLCNLWWQGLFTHWSRLDSGPFYTVLWLYKIFQPFSNLIFSPVWLSQCVEAWYCAKWWNFPSLFVNWIEQLLRRVRSENVCVYGHYKRYHMH